MSLINVEMTSAAPLAEALKELEKNAPRKVYRRVARVVLPPLERTLDRYLAYEPPPRDDRKFIWSHNPAAQARARRWWFWAVRQGIVQTDGRHYVRTGGMIAGWQAQSLLDQGSVTISIHNPSRGASYVYGTDEHRGVPGHITTGWPQIGPVMTHIMETVETDIQELWAGVIDEYL